MDVASDSEDFVPPTPQNPRKPSPQLKSSRTKNSVSKLTSNLNKKSNQNSKRKKISGASPDLKKFKDKTKQVSLLSFIKKDSDTNVKSSEALSLVKVNLFRKPDAVNSNLLPTVELSEKSKVNDNLFKNVESEFDSCDGIICAEVKNLKIGLCDDSSDFDLTKKFSKSNCNEDSTTCQNKEALISKEVLSLKNIARKKCISKEYSIDSENCNRKKYETTNQTDSFQLNQCNSFLSIVGSEPGIECTLELNGCSSIKNNVNSDPDVMHSVNMIEPSIESVCEVQSSSNDFTEKKQIVHCSDSNENTGKCTDDNLPLIEEVKNNISCETNIPSDPNNPGTSVLKDCCNMLNLKSCNLNIEDKSNVQDQSFSWLNDDEWKDYSSLDIQDFSLETSSSEKSLCLGSSLQKSFLYKVKEVDKNCKNEVVLLLAKQNSESNKLRTCILRGFWIDTLTQPGDSVHVLKEFINDEAIIDNQSGFLVVNPDFLLSSTAVVSTLFCMRKAALNYVLPQWSSGNNVMMIGNLVHDIFQQSVNHHAESVEDVSSITEQVFKKRDFLLAMSCQDSPEEEVRGKVLEYVPSIVSWIKKHCAFKRQIASKNLQITFVKAVEDNVWCPKYGIKGKIDMTVEAVLPDKSVKQTLPLELKTGRPTYSAEHKGQINLYTLMLEERSKEISDGLLLYLKDTANMKLLSPDHNSRRGLIQLRNELTFYTRKWSSSCSEGDIENCHLPEPINSKKFCGKCPYVLPCTIYQKAFSTDKLLPTDHAMISLISSSTNHLLSSHLEYFIHWSNLLLLESTSNAINNAFWIEEASIREKKGMCLSWLHLDFPGRNIENGTFFINSFSRSLTCPSPSKLISVGVREGDYVAVSNQNNFDEVAIIMGYVFLISEDKVEVASDRDLSSTPEYKNYLFRIDKQVSSSATSVIRNNLMRLMDNDSDAQRLRKLIIDKSPPSFLKSLPKNVVILGRPILKALNKVQQKVILKALMAEDYFIIKGMPGTGKTSTIVALVRLLVALGQSVLLTSYTHSAIDNILIKLRKYEKFVRIGQETRIHSNLKENSFETLTKDFTSALQFKQFMEEQKVVAATCLGINHAIFKVRSFDVCIVDEASQINQIACIGPLFHAKKFILVGDDKQLPPLVTNEKARIKGMQECLLQRLGNADNCLELVIQYRMNQEIMRLCNTLTYDGILRCGSDDIAKATLKICPSQSLSASNWLSSTFDSNIEKSVVLLNTDAISFKYEDKGEGKEINNLEAQIILTILNYLFAHNISELQIGIITPYRRQVDLIENKLKYLKMNEVEVNTVDQYQGRDKDVIIISCVKSHLEFVQKGIILNDERRLNVAVSRAKRKLLIIGSKSTLMLYTPCAKLLQCLKSEQILNVPSGFLPS